MEAFLEIAGAAGSAHHLDYSFTSSLTDHYTSANGVSECIGGLIDAYGAAPTPVAQQAILRALRKVLQGVLHVSCSATAGLSGAEQWLSTVDRTCSGTLCLAMDDCLLLAMFLSDLSTIADAALFHEFVETVKALLRLALPLVYAPKSGAASEEETDGRASLKTELTALRSMVMRRLTSTVAALRRVTPQRDCLGVGVSALWTVLGCFPVIRGEPEATADSLAEDTDQIIEEMVLPLEEVVEDQLQVAQRGASSGARGGGASHTLLTMVLRHLEDVLWICLRAGKDAYYCGVSTKVLNSVLFVLQRHAAIQQHRQVDTGASGADVLRVYTVQRAIQRLLSAALSPEMKDIVPEAIQNAAAAAVATFGGQVPSSNPFSKADSVLPPLHTVVETADAGRWAVPHAAREDDSDDEHPAPTEQSQVRRCVAVLAAAASGAGMFGVDADMEGFEGDEDALAGFLTGEVPLRSSLGLISAQALVDVVTSSVAALDLLSEDTIRELHVQGLQVMQHTAARKQQREELERHRVVEQQGVEAIPAARLLAHVKDAVAIQSRGAQTLRRVTARAKLERAAFSSVLASYESARGETEAAIRVAQALIARTLVQLPPSLADSALDELCLRLRKELVAEARLQKPPGQAAQGRTAGSGFHLVDKTTSYYQLVLQVLFMSFAAMAPFHDRGLSPFLLLGDAGGVDSDEGAAASILRNENAFFIDTDNPIAFLHDDDTQSPSYALGRKRGRDEGLAVAEADDGGGEFNFGNDTAAAPCAYSHLLCRVVELIETQHLSALLLDVLMQAPVLTRYVWGYVYHRLCLSADQPRCHVGFWVLTKLAERRVVYRTCAVHLMLHLSMSSNDYARRLAIRQIGLLLSPSPAAGGVSVLDEAAQASLVRYAKKQLLAIPAYSLPADLAEADMKVSASGEMDGEGVGAAQHSTSAREVRERKKLSDLLSRHLGLFLMLCTRQPRELFGALLDVYKQCVERNNSAMAKLIPENADVLRMTQYLLKSDTTRFMATVMPVLRRYARDATLLVQALLWSIHEQLRRMCVEGTMEDMRQVATALVGHGKSMFETSTIPLGGIDIGDGGGPRAGNTSASSASGPVLHDVRFLTPFLSLLPAVELRQTYLRSFLYFVQIQLQLQQQRQYQQQQQRGLGGGAAALTLSCKERSYVVIGTELQNFIKSVIREVIVKSPIDFADGVPRGLSRVDFLVYLHRAPEETAREAAAAAAAASTSGAAERASTSLPPIGVVTTTEVVRVCLSLTRTFDDTTVETLYGPAEMQGAIDHMMRMQPSVPSQLMATVLLASSIFGHGRSSDFVRVVMQKVLTPLERVGVWQTDPALWKGVLLFAEKYYHDCSGFLVNLPDAVLSHALQELPLLREAFRQEHGNNASFGHILGAL